MATETLVTSNEEQTGQQIDTVQDLQGKIATSPTVYTYPLDLHQSDEYPHSVIFYINARSNSRVGSAAATAADSNRALAAAQRDYSDQYTSENRVKSEQYNDALGIAGGLATGVAAYGALKNMAEGDAGSARGKMLQSALAGGVALTALNQIADVSTTVRLLTAIELVTMTPPVAAYGASYEQEELGAAAGLVGQGFGNNTSFEDIMKGGGATAELLARGAISAAAQIPQSLGVNANVGAALEATSKKVANPYREQLFKNMEFRKFQFQYQFHPKSESELNNVMEIIQNFKYHMHPEKDRSRLFLIYPSEFNIEYRYKGSRNTYLSKISSCVLENMKVTYGGADFTSFRDTNGAPSQINLELSFAELETLTNDRIGQDWKDSY